MRDPVTGQYRFTALHYPQRRGGLDVFDSRLTVLVRRVPGHPVVLASANLRPLGAYQPPAAAPPDPEVLTERLRAQRPGMRVVGAARPVIWAGAGPAAAPPRLASVVVGERGERGERGEPGARARRLIVLDAVDGSILHERDLILHGDVTGSVLGVATDGVGADLCHDEAPVGLPYARVEVGDEIAFTDAVGAFAIDAGPGPVIVRSMLRGLFFEVRNEAGIDSQILHPAVPGTPVALVHNAANAFEFERSQVNAYRHANVVRDFVLSVHPDYPAVAEQQAMPVHVNISDDCNAFYDSSGQSINFFTSGAGCANTAFDTVVYHEYGHHLVAAAGSGQGAYGEGMSDVVAMLVTDDPRMGVGWFDDCDGALRDGDNDCLYDPVGCSDCGSEAHACGRLLSGTIWSLRNGLAAADPATYRETLSSLVINSILLHEGAAIDPAIAIDFLVLDDDNADLLDGTPHVEAIVAAFAAHGLDPPGLDLLELDLPGGIPSHVQPAGGTAMHVVIRPAAAAPRPGTATLHVSPTGAPGTFEPLPLTPSGAGAYDAVFPPAACGELLHFYLSAETTGGLTATWPDDAPESSLAVVAATSVTEVFADDFESDLGWTVESDEGLTSGAWGRGVPLGDGSRGDPTSDADGSGSCFVTGIDPGDDDVDGGATRLVSPPLDAGGPGIHVIEYDRWLSNDAGANPGQDPLLVEVARDGEDAWTDVEMVGPGGAAAAGGWRRATWRLEAHLAPSAAVRLRFVVGDAEPASVVEGGVDGVRVRRATCSCAGDVTGDGSVDVDDLTAVILAWGSGDEAADTTGDGVVDVDDMVLVLLGWGGC
jgi:hypothetical protein